MGMGGAHIAHKPDSTMPIFINGGNPAAYSLIRLTSLEVGGFFNYSDFKGANGTGLRKWGTYFSYGSLGFPIAGNGGMCLGITPFSHTGYDTESKSETPGIGEMTYRYNGSGSLNKAFLGYGVAPFNKRLVKFRTRKLFVDDSLRTLRGGAFKVAEFGNKMLSDLSIGFNVNYIFGDVVQTTRVIYPSSFLYNNTYRVLNYNVGDFTGNFGIQTAITLDSAKNRNGNGRRHLKEKVKITLGYFMNLGNPMKLTHSNAIYNYILNSSGEEILRDTAFFNVEQRGTVTLPVEQGFGIGYKKGEKLNILADFAITGWQDFKFLEETYDLADNARISLGANYVPEKYAAGRGAFWRRVNYRFGVSYQTGYVKIKDAVVSDYYVSAGLGLPVGVGRLSSMVNISAQYGQMGPATGNLLKENYWRVHFGFTFSDRWFQKFRYD